MSGGSSGGSGTGSSANVYEPAGQGTADYNWNQILQPLINQSIAGTSPGAAYYPQAQMATQNYITQNPSADIYYGTAQQAPQLGANINATAGSNINALESGIGQLSALQPSIAGSAGTPAYGTAAAGANTGAAGGTNLMGAAGQVLSTGFDPQQALYNQQSSNALNSQNAINAMSGVAGTPYGAGVTGQNQQLFNQNWLNQQLGRQQSALGSAAPAYTAGEALTQAPLNTQNNQLSLINSLLGSNLGSIAGAGTSAMNLGTGGMEALLAGGAAPYNASNAIGQNDLSALSNLVNLGNTQYQLPESVLNNLQSYMGLGQSASQIANSIDQTQNQQLASIGSGIGTGTSLGLNALGLNNGGLGTALGIGDGAASDASLFNPGAVADTTFNPSGFGAAALPFALGGS